MNIIFLGSRPGQSKTVRFGLRHLVCLILVIGFFAALFVYFGYTLNSKLNNQDQHGFFEPNVVSSWVERLNRQRRDIDALKGQSQEQVDALMLRLADIQARLMRLDALGQRLTEVAKLEHGEFDFTTAPALGGPIESDMALSFTQIELKDSLDSISQQISDREQQLNLIDKLLVSRDLKSELFIAGRPVTWGWMSSTYGYRSDPFTGRRAWHAGVDFAGKDGSDIIAVASGVVTWASERSGYGLLVEINHGDGYVTRYGHCRELMVEVGAIVSKGQPIALMGSTGRSTGTHVHYEVLKDGKTMDPKKYILRASN